MLTNILLIIAFIISLTLSGKDTFNYYGTQQLPFSYKSDKRPSSPFLSDLFFGLACAGFFWCFPNSEKMNYQLKGV